MFRILTILMIVASSTAQYNLDSMKFATFVRFVKETTDAEINFLNSLDNRDTASAISDTLERMDAAHRMVKKFAFDSGTADRFFVIIDPVRSVLDFTDPFVELMETLDGSMYEVVDLYDMFDNILQNKSHLNQRKLAKWLEKSVSTADGDLYWALDKMYTIIMYPKGYGSPESLFHQMAATFPIMGQDKECGYDLSIQQRMFYFYEMVMLNQLRGFVMKLFANTITSINTKSIDNTVYTKAGAELVITSVQYMSASQFSMEGISRKIGACDPKIKTPDTYAAFDGFIQDILISLVETNPQGNCRGSCSDIYHARPEKCTDQSNYCAQKPCRGHLDECSKIGDIEICELPAESKSRYAWYKDVDGMFYGHHRPCQPSRADRHGAGIRRRAFDFLSKQGPKCPMCRCMCINNDKNSSTIQAVSFLPQIVDIHDNRAVAGIRLVASDHIIQIQMKHGKLRNNGRIWRDTLAWQDQPIRFDQKSFSVYDESSSSWISMKEGTDYGFLNAFSRGFHLDEIIVDDGYVITGARFNRVPDRNNIVPQIEVHATRYDPVTNKLDASDSKWVTPQNMPDKSYRPGGQEYELADLDNPLKSPINLPMSKPGQWLSFQTSSAIKDAGQHTIPFFDTLPVETNPPIASTGLELLVKSSPGFGGFLALRLTAVDLHKLWPVTVKRNDFLYYKSYFDKNILYRL